MNIIFHHPLPLDPNATSASGIRPLKMLKSFEALGYSVDLVTGYAKERRNAINKVKSKIKSGVKYDFVYSESSTMPTILTEKHHLPIAPTLDFSFFRFCYKNNIPVGLFYRDIHWLFDFYYSQTNFIKANIAKLCYLYDLIFYQKYVNRLYLPSAEMKKYIPYISHSKFSILPPGHDYMRHDKSELKPIKKGSLKIFYVGGITGKYSMHKLFSVVNSNNNIQLTICTRKDEWDSVSKEYPNLTDNISVVHTSGKKMECLMMNSDIVSIFIEPNEYWDFAVPVKLYEYIGHLKPIIATSGTLTGNFIDQHNIGWSVPYNSDKLEQLLLSLINSPEKILQARDNINRIYGHHSWESRAKKVVTDLKKV